MRSLARRWHLHLWWLQGGVGGSEIHNFLVLQGFTHVRGTQMGEEAMEHSWLRVLSLKLKKLTKKATTSTNEFASFSSLPTLPVSFYLQQLLIFRCICVIQLMYLALQHHRYKKTFLTACTLSCFSNTFLESIWEPRYHHYLQTK